MSELPWKVRYPIHLPKEGIDTKGVSGIAVTNHLHFKKLVDIFIKSPDYPGWAIEQFLPGVEPGIISDCISQDKGWVVVGDPWHPKDGKGASAGLMRSLNEGRVYEIEYRIDDDKTKDPLIGYTNKYFFAEMVENMEPMASGACWYTEYLSLKSEEELEEYKKADGGCEPFHKDIADEDSGDDGWVSKGLQAAYLQYLARKKTREDARGDEEKLGV